MTRYVLQREDGKYVTWHGLGSSYSHDLTEARVFEEEELKREKCGNEIAIPLDSLKPKGWD